MKVGIIGSGIYLPKTILRNEELNAEFLNYRERLTKCSLNEWVNSRYGISERRLAAADEKPSDMAYRAVCDALTNSGMKAQDLDFLILNTAFGDYTQPTTATTVQRKLGMRSDTFAFEINMPCSGPIFGLVTALQFILGGQYKNGAVVGVDKMSSLTDPADFRSATLFGDASGAFIIGHKPLYTFERHYLASKGESGEESEFGFVVPAGGSVNPTSEQTLHQKKHHLQMNRKVVDRFVMEAIEDIMRNLPPPKGGYDRIIPSQAAKPLLEKAFSQAGVDTSKIEFSLEKLGNTSSASVFITFHLANLSALPSGSQLLLTGVGAGLNWGGVILTRE